MGPPNNDRKLIESIDQELRCVACRRAHVRQQYVGRRTVRPEMGGLVRRSKIKLHDAMPAGATWAASVRGARRGVRSVRQIVCLYIR
jgi:hypothetical protein